MLKGIEIESYRPGQQKMPLIALTLLTLAGYVLSYVSAEHIKKHMINVVSGWRAQRGAAINADNLTLKKPRLGRSSRPSWTSTFTLTTHCCTK